ncbi:hypothetical protein BC826DRAFT_552246 [Russula brevipes]|nr:hypothetical protein BC826DRAFT_552246 [Russula brevipes]
MTPISPSCIPTFGESPSPPKVESRKGTPPKGITICARTEEGRHACRDNGASWHREIVLDLLRRTSTPRRRSRSFDVVADGTFCLSKKAFTPPRISIHGLSFHLLEPLSTRTAIQAPQIPFLLNMERESSIYVLPFRGRNGGTHLRGPRALLL